MEGNKDDAAKCLRIGKDALESGDRSRALKFLSKARRLDPSLPIDDLLSAASNGDGAPDDSSSAPPESSSVSAAAAASSSSSSSVRSRAKAPSDGSSSSSNSTYTPEQAEIVREIKRKQKDYYQILGLEKTCTVEDVRKAYRKLSLKVHPDKNKAPGAEDAFKSVSKAFQCLSNEESRKRYDISGSDEPSHHRRAPARYNHAGFDGFYDADFDADEIFRNFFFGGMAPARTTPFGTFHFRTGGMGAHNHGAQASSNSTFRVLIQILPVIILLLLNFLPSNEPIYTLSRSYPYEHKIQTTRGVPFFVKSTKFEEEYPKQSSERTALESRVEREYVVVLTQNCRVEIQRKHWGLSNQTPHCDMLREFEATAQSY